MAEAKYAGIDVGKKSLALSVMSGGTKGVFKQFANDAKGQQGLLEWLGPQGVERIVIEPTGIYHQAVLAQMQTSQLPVFLVHPTRVKAFRKAFGYRNKDDQSDAKLLAEIGRIAPDTLRKPNPHYQIQADLRQFMAYREELLEHKTLIGNRLEAETSAQVKTWLSEDLQQLQQRLDTLEAQINTLMNQLPEVVALHKAIKGVGTWTIAATLAWLPKEIWGRAKAAVGYAGIHPCNERSGTTLDKAQLSKQGPPQIRKHLFMAAMVATQYNPDLAAFYNSLIHRGKPKMSALNALAHKILRRMMGVLKTFYLQNPHLQPLLTA